MSFVHGHARHAGWVVAHRRAPHRAEDGQLPLPVPRPPPSAECGGHGPAQGDEQGAVVAAPPGEGEA